MKDIKFWTEKLFRKRGEIIISYSEIARRHHICLRSAKNYVKRDLATGLISRNRRSYLHPIFHKLFCGRNSYFVTEFGRSTMQPKEKEV